MSLISDPDYLIHNLRLTYLRHLEDPYGPRIIRSGPRYLNNPHVLAAGLADSERWPELNVESSPDPSDDEEPGKRPVARRMRSGYTGGSTSLKHTQTIMGNRSGALGMRVTGKRSSTTGEAIIPMRPSESNLGRVRADSEPTPLPTTPSSASEPVTPGSPGTYDGAHISVSKRRSAGGSSLSEVAASILDKPDTSVQTSQQEPAAPKLHAMPSFSKIADMQARRQRRRAHFSSAGNNTGRPVLTSRRPMNPDISSSDEGAGISGSIADDDGFDRLSEHGDGMEGEMEEFDPDFAPARIGADSDMSEADSSVSHLINVTGSSLEALQPPPANGVNRFPSPIEEDAGEHPDHRRSRSSRSSTEHSDSTAQMPPTKPDTRPDRDPDLTRQQAALSARRRTRRMTLINNNAPTQDTGLFVRLKKLPPRQTTSALTAKLASSSTSTNPFTETYALISGRAEMASTKLQVFFPHARSPIGKPLELKVRKDASIEEVIGFALWSYWEEGWQPKLDEGLSADDARKAARFSAAGWVLRIAEDDGEVDEDFPAPDRMGKISKFNFDAYAIIEANPAQAAQNQQLETKIVRRPSRIIVAKKKSEPTTATALAPAPSMGPSTSTLFPTALGSSFGISASLSLSSSHGPQVLLRIAIEEASDTVHYSTTISVSATMYMQEVLESVCRKWKIEDTKEWALVTNDFKILVPLDRTVASLEGSSDLVLVRRTSLRNYELDDADRRYGRSTDPNASIFKSKRVSEVPGRAKYVDTGMQVIAAYKRYTVYRKVPMLVARLVRTLAIDGDYIHIMPSANKAKGVFDSGKTYSYHIKSVHSVQRSKASANFKLVFRRDMGDKRYDFEAESEQAANEIVTTIRGLKANLDRSSTVSKQRRSRHWKEP